MNEKLRAASVLLVSKWRLIGQDFQLSNVEPTQDGSAPAASQPVSVLFYSTMYIVQSTPGFTKFRH
jgi:hypothetical protein